MLTLDLVRKKDRQRTLTRGKQLVWGKQNREPFTKPVANEPGFEGKQDLKGVCTGRSLQAEGMV